MTSAHPRAGQRHRAGRWDPKAGPDWASPRGLPGRPLRRALGNPLWCPAPQGGGKPLVSAGMGAKTAPSQPSASPLHVRFGGEHRVPGGPDALPGRARPAAAAAAAVGRWPVASNEGAELMAGKRKNNPAGSTNNYRGDVLRVLGALKVATTDQIQRIGAPHLTFRHADKPTPSKQKQARTASHTAALSDMRKHGLSENGGSTETGDALRNLTPKGLEAASYELRRPVTEMGSTARGAGSSGASHPMAVNETVIAMLRPKPDMARLAVDPPHVQAAAQAAVAGPDGIGTIASFWTEVPLPATGTWNVPGKGGAQADLVLTAPQDGVPLLFIEVDNCHETAEELAAKLEKYARFFRRKVKDTDGKERPMWRTRWTAPEGRYGELLRGRVYGADHDHPGPLPHRDYAELVGGPLDGLLLDITGWTADEIQTGVALMTELGQFGAGGRALYDPRPGERNRHPARRRSATAAMIPGFHPSPTPRLRQSFHVHEHHRPVPGALTGYRPGAPGEVASGYGRLRFPEGAVVRFHRTESDRPRRSAPPGPEGIELPPN